MLVQRYPNYRFISIMALSAALLATPPAHGEKEQTYTVTTKEQTTEDTLRLTALTRVIQKLVTDDEICKDPEHRAIANKILSKIRTEQALPSYTLAELLLTIVTLDGTVQPLEREQHQNRSTSETTRALLRHIEAGLIERNIGAPQRVAIPVMAMIQKYRIPLAALALPCIIYGSKKLFDTYIAEHVGLTKGKADSGKTTSSELLSIFAQYIKPAAQGFTLWKVICTKPVQAGVKRVEDIIYGNIAWLMDRPYRDSNPASSSKVPLRETPAPHSTKEFLQFIAHAISYAPEVTKLRGLSPRTLLFTGDRSLTADLARGLAHEISKQLKTAGKGYGCKIAVIHASKLTADTASLKDEIEEIKSRNQSAVILIEDIDWLTTIDEELRTKAISELINHSSKATAQHEQYIIIATAQSADGIDPILRRANLFAHAQTFAITTDHPDVASACIRRIETLFAIQLRNAELITMMKEYIIAHSFADLVTIVHRAYTKGISCINQQLFDEDSIRAELLRVA